MVFEDASSVLWAPAALLGIWLVYRLARRFAKAGGRAGGNPIEADGEVIEKLEAYLSELEKLIAAARHEAQRLEAAIAKARSMGLGKPQDTLAAIEGLADAAAMEDPGAMEEVVEQIRSTSSIADGGGSPEEKAMKIVSLVQRGYTAQQIARRLKMPLGDVEMLLSTRS
jgi:DNA-binding NarL/FixJ family response regulator